MVRNIMTAVMIVILLSVVVRFDTDIFAYSNGDFELVDEYNVSVGEEIKINAKFNEESVESLSYVVSDESVIASEVNENLIFEFTQEGIFYIDVGIADFKKTIKIFVGDVKPLYSNTLTLNHDDLNIYYQLDGRYVKADIFSGEYYISRRDGNLYIGKEGKDNILLHKIGVIKDKVLYAESILRIKEDGSLMIEINNSEVLK